jgi:hypothetical protein
VDQAVVVEVPEAQAAPVAVVVRADLVVVMVRVDQVLVAATIEKNPVKL